MADRKTASTLLLGWRRNLLAAWQLCGPGFRQYPLAADLAADAERTPLSLSEFVALLEAGGRQYRRSSTAWNAGLRFEWPLENDLGRAVLGCRSLGTAFHWICHYFPLIQDAASLRLDVDREWTTLSYRIIDPTIWPRHEDAMSTLGIYANLLRTAASDAWSQVQVTVEAEQQDIGVDLESVVNGSVVYGGQANSLRFPTGIINAPLSLAPPCDPALFKRLSAELSRLKRSIPISERTRHMIYREMHEGCINQEHIARQLGVSSRTLRRRLSEQGWSFQALLDECRMQFASHEFRTRRRISLSDVALRLGYSEHSTFSRAFSRWAGMAPQEYRRSLSASRAPGFRPN